MSDISGLNELVADLSAAPLHAKIAARSVVQKGCLNIKQDAQRLISGLRHAPLYPSSITYETEEKGNGNMEGVVGPDKSLPGRQGGLGNILEYGTAKNPPLAHLGPALDLEGPRFMKAIEKLADEAF